MIICIESFENEEYLNGLQFVRPNETFHQPTQTFLRQNAFLCQSVEHISIKPIRQDEHLLSHDDIRVCESRYHQNTKIFKKI